MNSKKIFIQLWFVTEHKMKDAISLTLPCFYFTHLWPQGSPHLAFDLLPFLHNHLRSNTLLTQLAHLPAYSALSRDKCKTVSWAGNLQCSFFTRNQHHATLSSLLPVLYKGSLARRVKVGQCFWRYEKRKCFLLSVKAPPTLLHHITRKCSSPLTVSNIVTHSIRHSFVTLCR